MIEINLPRCEIHKGWRIGCGFYVWLIVLGVMY